MRLMLLVVFLVNASACSGYDIMFANADQRSVALSVRASDGSLSQEMTIDGHSWVVFGLQPRRDCHLIVTVTRDGKPHTSNVGYFENGSFGSECYVVRADGSIGRC